MSDAKEARDNQGKHGSWVWEMYQYTPYCSICGGPGLRGPANGPRFNFCPHCGADMREAGEGTGGLRIVEVGEEEGAGLNAGSDAGREPERILFRCRHCEKLRRTDTFKRTESGQLILVCPRCGKATVAQEEMG